MSSKPAITLYHHPHSRSAGARVLLEELGVDYRIELVNLQAGEQRRPEFLALNPMGKLPTLVDGDVVVTEQAAVYLYLADRFPEAGLAPAIGDALRGPYLRWMVFYGSCFEPAVVDRSMKREGADPSTSPYGDYERMLATLEAQLARGPWILGERFSAADVLWAAALNWTTQFGLVPKSDVIAAYIERATARPAFKRAAEKDAELLAAA
ncbi:glutathione S-transferase [Lysobacter arseniciresistens ZS79]|uniref:Glutathione S-transferase n=1 Tax=Lysobacter arseniciresistens ZS79 TaxID=913325 RepID=A0A0A0F622_9GAMM|nr:glutathione S-transferase family protein [Lysobacter arseniciresistens]KGM57803.1 glutathione S-transferase [Lysobacter arseniciresistens ZS79]